MVVRAAPPLSRRDHGRKTYLAIACGMIRGRIQCVEAMVFVFNLRPVGNNEADFPEAADDVFGHLR